MHPRPYRQPMSLRTGWPGSVRNAEQFIHDTIKPTDRVAIIVSAGPPRLAQTWTSHPADLDSVLDSITPTDIERDLPSAVILARTQIGRKVANARIVILSDGAWDTDDDDRIRRAAGGIPLGLALRGTSSAVNVGITGMDSRRDAFGSNQRQVFVRVRNYGNAQVIGKIEMRVDGASMASQTITLPPASSIDATFTGSKLSGGGLVEARLSGFTPDNLSSDNSAFMMLPPVRRIRILLVSKGNLFLEKGLALDPSVDLYETDPSQYALIHGRYDLEVFDDFAPASLPPGSYLVFHAVGDGMPITTLGPDLLQPALVDWSETSPLMRFVDMTDVHFAMAAHVRAANWGQTVVDGDQGPLVVAGERFGRRCIWVAATTSGGDLPLKVAFPIFLTNAAQWLTDSSGSSGALHPGDPIVLPAGSGDWRLRSPNADLVTFDCGTDTARPCVFSDDKQAGLYRFSTQTRQIVSPANVEVGSFIRHSRARPSRLFGAACCHRSFRRRRRRRRQRAADARAPPPQARARARPPSHAIAHHVQHAAPAIFE